MSNEIKDLIKKLEAAQSEEDVLSALDGFPRRLTDEELDTVAGGNIWNIRDIFNMQLPPETKFALAAEK